MTGRWRQWPLRASTRRDDAGQTPLDELAVSGLAGDLGLPPTRAMMPARGLSGAKHGARAKFGLGKSENHMSIFRKVLLTASAAAAFAFLPQSANAQGAPLVQQTAIVIGDLNLRSGIGVSNPVIAVMPSGAQVGVVQCQGSPQWCYVSWQGLFGWASASYLALSGPPVAPAPRPRLFPGLGPRF